MVGGGCREWRLLANVEPVIAMNLEDENLRSPIGLSRVLWRGWSDTRETFEGRKPGSYILHQQEERSNVEPSV
jgi:hypothetical protein